ncbi:hypothetical protein A5844_000613 [Enterococcus sp. 10A9_DIV0425]|uniref:N-acetyltransferase domain-containing protein n=1 Tax=Candidatus Enterococcus wittei TaxID=1987383 RepID=A0A2C9XQC3_9ENTE|nr:GNAT family N-acetyltransferase [Enterococcus sp. 10A9_DIV0425]OTP12380.1 hypothetical protein A5844_000613 [Enterococcus sp. 10A9_DIV0425]THE12275.1 N-acetyltransferase family protein [Enterococcus hirae]
MRKITIYYSIATIQDLPKIVAIYNQSIASKQSTADIEPVTVLSRESWFNAHTPNKRPLWIIKKDQRIIGWISLSDFYGRPAYSHTAEISIYLDETVRGQKLGQQALEFVESQLDRLAVHIVLAFVFNVNQASRRLFLKNGYEVWGDLPAVAQMDEAILDLMILGKNYKDKTD